jgi:ankyrin repeat protein
VNPNAIDKHGTTPIHRAVRNRCAAVVKALLDVSADPHAANRGVLATRVLEYGPRRERLSRRASAATGDLRAAASRRRWRWIDSADAVRFAP